MLQHHVARLLDAAAKENEHVQAKVEELEGVVEEVFNLTEGEFQLVKEEVFGVEDEAPTPHDPADELEFEPADEHGETGNVEGAEGEGETGDDEANAPSAPDAVTVQSERVCDIHLPQLILIRRQLYVIFCLRWRTCTQTTQHPFLLKNQRVLI